MDSLWSAYDAWLETHFPEGARALNPGATEEELGQLESIIGASLPSDYRQWLAIHNGQVPDAPGVLCSDEFLSTQRILDEWQCMMKLAETEVAGFVAQSTPPDCIQAVWWHRLWIPITADGAGNLVCLDLAPGPRGTVGQVIDFDHETVHRTVLAARFRDWVSAYVDDVVAGLYVYSDDYGRFMPRDEV